MAIYEAKVIGPREVGGVASGGTVLLDDALVNIDALVEAEHIGATLKRVPEPEPEEPVTSTDPEPSYGPGEKRPAKRAAKKKGDA
jgi:hypothetical protein